MLKKIFALLICLCLLCGMCPAHAEMTKYSASFFGVFDTVIDVIGYAESEEVFNEELAQVKRIYGHLNELFDNYNAYEGVNNLYVLNQTAMNEPVTVEPELFELLLWAQQNQRLYGSSQVNIAMGSVLSIWHEYRENGLLMPDLAQVPPMDKLQQAAEHTDIFNLVLDTEAMTVFYADPDLRLDLGAIAKGFATEKAAQYLLSSRMPSFIISAGGNVRAGISPADGRKNWGVGVQDPNNVAYGAGGYVDILYLNGLSAVTSGDYQRYYMVGDKRYHHLISPITLMPTDYCRSVTVITEDSAWADYMSTTLFLMPQEDGLKLVNSMDGIEALWIMDNGQMIGSTGIAQYARTFGATAN